MTHLWESAVPGSDQDPIVWEWRIILYHLFLWLSSLPMNTYCVCVCVRVWRRRSFVLSGSHRVNFHNHCNFLYSLPPCLNISITDGNTTNYNMLKKYSVLFWSQHWKLHDPKFKLPKTGLYLFPQKSFPSNCKNYLVIYAIKCLPSNTFFFF